MLGIDLEPTKTTEDLPNCRFEVKDFSTPWNFKEKFDFIYLRMLGGLPSLQLLKRIHANLEPGGWAEFAEWSQVIYNTNHSYEGTALETWNRNYCLGRQAPCWRMVTKDQSPSGFSGLTICSVQADQPFCQLPAAVQELAAAGGIRRCPGEKARDPNQHVAEEQVAAATRPDGGGNPRNRHGHPDWAFAARCARMVGGQGRGTPRGGEKTGRRSRVTLLHDTVSLLGCRLRGRLGPGYED